MLIVKLVIWTYVVNRECVSLSLDDNKDDYLAIRPLLEKWTDNDFRAKKLTIVFDNYDEKEPFVLPLAIYQDTHTSKSLVTMEHLISLDSANNTIDYQSIESGNCVLLLSPDIVNIRRVLKSPELWSFWQPESFYILRQTGNDSSSPHDDSKQRFLEWALERLWRFRRIHRIVVSIEDRYVWYDPFNYDNHNGGGAVVTDCRDSCGRWKEERSILSIIESNATRVYHIVNDDRVNFDLFPLKISIFTTQTMIKTGDSYGGMDFKYTIETCRMMNVTPRFIVSKAQFGWMEDNGVFTGTLGDLVYKKADVTFNQFFVKHYLTRQVQTGVSFTSDRLCVLVPKAEPIPEYLIIVRVFTLRSWLVILAAEIVITMIYTLMKPENGRKKETPILQEERREGRFERANFLDTRCRLVDQSCVFSTVGRTGEEKGRSGTRERETRKAGRSREIYFTILEYLTRVFLQLMKPFEPARPRVSERVLVITGLTMSLILNGVFTSKLTSTFSKLAYFEDIHTLEELDESGFTILTNSRDLMEDALSDKDSLLLRRLREKMEYANETEINRRLFVTKDVGVLQRIAVLPLKYNKHLREKIHIVEECPKVYLLAHLMSKGTPFQTRINTILGRLNNGGFYDKWFNDMSMLLKKDPSDVESNVHLKLTMKHLCIPFVILLIGLSSSTIVFLYERRQSNF